MTTLGISRAGEQELEPGRREVRGRHPEAEVILQGQD